MEDSQEGNVTGIDEHKDYTFRNGAAEDLYESINELVEEARDMLAPHELIGILEASKQLVVLELHELVE